MSDSLKVAIDFFHQLALFSQRVFIALGIPDARSPWSSEGLDAKGAIVHYTGGTDPLRTIRWFMVRKYQAEVVKSKRSSAHVVIANGWPAGMKSHAWDLDHIKVLESMVVECVPPNRKAWHAAWANDDFYGIEVVNPGSVLPKDRAEEKRTIRVNKENWLPYSHDQVSAVTRVLAHFRNLQSYQFDTSLILGHEHVQKNKKDPGPVFPLSLLRDYLSDRTRHTGGWEINSLQAVEEMRARLLQTYSRGDMSWDKVFDAVKDIEATFDPWYKALLRLMGYPTSSGGDGIQDVDKQSIRIFQRMMRLKRDGIPGKKTKAAIVDRATYRGFLS